MLEDASIVIATYNNSKTLERVLKSMFELDYPEEYEIIVINDGSTDSTKEMLEKFSGNEKIKVINILHSGVCRARNAGIEAAKYPIIINMDHDCIPGRKWLRQMVEGFDSKEVGVVSAYDYYGGTSTAFRKELLDKVGGYDEEYKYYREDTDLSFKIMDLGYSFKLVKADYIHSHKEVKPKGLIEVIRHILQRLGYHQNDVLLYRKHPTKLAREFLHIKLGFLVNPVWDFKIATGLWQKGAKMRLSSPRGIVFLENKSPLHLGLIVLLGICYVLAVKASRLAGSIRFKKLLI